MPYSKAAGEVVLGAGGEPKRQRPELLRGLGLRFPGEILRHRLDLVELAVLHRDAVRLKYLRHASLAINHRTGDGPALPKELIESFPVYPRRLEERFFPPEVPLECGRSKDHHSVPAAPEGHVGSDGCSSGCG